MLPVIPFLALDASIKAAWAAGLFIFAEVTWWLAMPLLGKEIIEWSQHGWRRIKAYFRGDKIDDVTGMAGMADLNKATDSSDKIKK